MMLVYKVFNKPDYDSFFTHGKTKGSANDVRDNFIHFSSREQLSETIKKHFSCYDLLFIMVFCESTLSPKLKWEVSRNFDLYPHYYDYLSLSKVLYTIQIKV